MSIEEKDNSQEKNIEEVEIIQDSETHERKFKMKNVSEMYKEWFLDYASYVILERAVPHLDDGLKPVHRRILHSMRRLDDGRYNKVANIIGFTMQFHPHGDASIGDALVNLGQKELLIDMQGNWGNSATGDSAAAPRYIEARLSKFALEVVFNPKTTDWKQTYDGRNKEPITLPVKFPLLLNQGVEGIAVGLASKILPHNFNELVDASISILKNRNFVIYPDFLCGGMIDVEKYNDGLRGSSVRVRCKIIKEDKKTLKIIDLPFGKTTTTLIDSIIKSNEKGKIKIKKIDDNTAGNVEILVHLYPGTSLDKTIDALYVFTDCEIPISPNACVIKDNKPMFIGVKEMLKISTLKTVDLLTKELEIHRAELYDAWHNSLLEKIFIDNKIYNHIIDCKTMESIIETIDKGLDPFKKLLKREVVTDDIIKLTEIKIKRISKYNSFKADEYIKSIEDEIDKINYHLENIIQYSIDYFKRIKDKFGAGKERRTEIRNFDTIVATKVVVANEKLYVNRKEGFFGTGLKKDEYVCECSDIDNIIAFRKNGTFVVSKVSDKSFVGKDIIHISVMKKNDDRTIYNAIYKDGKNGYIMIKRFAVKSITRDKEYEITQGKEGSKILYFTANPNGEAEVVRVQLKPKPKLKKLTFDFSFSDLSIKGRSSKGNILTKNDVYRISLKEKGISTLGGRNIWFDSGVLRLNDDERGKYLGEFKGDEKILVIYDTGEFQIKTFKLSNHFKTGIILIEKFNPDKVLAAIHYDGEHKNYYVKRFKLDYTDKDSSFIVENQNSRLVVFSVHERPQVEISFSGKNKNKPKEIIDITEFISVKSFKARGNKLSPIRIKTIKEIEPLEPLNNNNNNNNNIESDNTDVITINTEINHELDDDTQDVDVSKIEKIDDTKAEKKSEEVQNGKTSKISNTHQKKKVESKEVQKVNKTNISKIKPVDDVQSETVVWEITPPLKSKEKKPKEKDKKNVDNKEDKSIKKNKLKKGSDMSGQMSLF